MMGTQWVFFLFLPALLCPLVFLAKLQFICVTSPMEFIAPTSEHPQYTPNT